MATWDDVRRIALGLPETSEGSSYGNTAWKVRDKHPERILEAAVRRMVPRNKLGRRQMTKLKIYAGPQHPHQAQQPVPISELTKQG